MNFLEKQYGSDEERVKLAFCTNDKKTLYDLAQDECLAVRLEVAGNENTPVAALELLSHDNDMNVRKQVAGNENSSSDIIQKLLKDSNESVVKEASYSHYLEE